ncbi:hypothetical protein KCU92_g224, partial [Aureobasidium melanogenum]
MSSSDRQYQSCRQAIIYYFDSSYLHLEFIHLDNVIILPYEDDDGLLRPQQFWYTSLSMASSWGLGARVLTTYTVNTAAGCAAFQHW